jgi:hypothetical protein
MLDGFLELGVGALERRMRKVVDFNVCFDPVSR